LDQVFHGPHPLADTPVNLIEKYTNTYYGLPFVAHTHWHLRFSHFVGYGSKYYAYLVSKAIAAQIWNNCFANDPLSSTAGENYRAKLLAYGGERQPSELVSSLIGFNIDNQALVKSLVESL
jgi:intermediate peptidase